ncbi:unnamed protein product [Prorocentrum cordatum]|nr:unnamed protein product [Polarella glacialis]
MGALLRLVRRSSEQAVRRGHYMAEGWGSEKLGVELRSWMSTSAEVSWIGRENVGVHQGALDGAHRRGQIAPPILMCDDLPLDVAMTVGRMVEPERPIFLVLELAEFDSAGGIALERLAGSSMQGLSLRSDFDRFAHAAATKMAGSEASIRSHMCAESDPYVFLCRDVTVFRGPRAQGFPLLEEPMNVHVIVVAMSRLRPSVQMTEEIPGHGRAEWYKDEADHTALLERLNLLGLVALQDADDSADALAPVLVLGSPGCAGPCLHPQGAVASSLKHWRRRFSPFFHSVMLCTGGRGGVGSEMRLAMHLDDVVNSQVHKIAENELLAQCAMPWHWDTVIIRLSACSQTLERVANKVAKRARSQPEPSAPAVRAAPASPDKQAKSDSTPQLSLDRDGNPTRRRSFRGSVVDSLAHSMRREIASEKGRRISDLIEVTDLPPDSGASGEDDSEAPVVQLSVGPPPQTLADGMFAKRPSTVGVPGALAAISAGAAAGPRVSVIAMPGRAAAGSQASVSRKSSFLRPADVSLSLRRASQASTGSAVGRQRRDVRMAPIAERRDTGLVLTSVPATPEGGSEDKGEDEDGSGAEPSHAQSDGGEAQAAEAQPCRRASTSGGRRASLGGGLVPQRRSSLVDSAAFAELRQAKDDKSLLQHIRRKSVEYKSGGGELPLTGPAPEQQRRPSASGAASAESQRRKSWSDQGERTASELKIREEARQRLMTRRASEADDAAEPAPAQPRRMSGGLVSFYGAASVAPGAGAGPPPPTGSPREAPRRCRPALGRKPTAAIAKGAKDRDEKAKPPAARKSLAAAKVAEELHVLALRFEELAQGSL